MEYVPNIVRFSISTSPKLQRHLLSLTSLVRREMVGVGGASGEVSLQLGQNSALGQPVVLPSQPQATGDRDLASLRAYSWRGRKLK